MTEKMPPPSPIVKPTEPVVEPPKAVVKPSEQPVVRPLEQPTHPVNPTPAEKLEKADAAKDVADARRREGEKRAILVRVEEILNDFSGIESHIPLNNEYWALLNQYRALG